MSTVPATLFYFPSAEALKELTRFEVVPTHNQEQTVYSVAAYNRFTGQYTMLADFHARGMADTFRDMCAVVAVASS